LPHSEIIITLINLCRLNIQENQLLSSLTQLTGQSFLMQTEFPKFLNVFEDYYELQYSESYIANRRKYTQVELFMTGNYKIA